MRRAQSSLWLAVLFLSIGCHSVYYYRQSRVAKVCGDKPGNPPIICIDPVKREPIPGHEKPHASRSKRQWVHFFFVTGNDDLQITCDALENIDHDGRGHAWGRVKQDAALGVHQYTAINASQRKGTDPTIIIDK
jgi:hypothetical protein